MQMELRAHSTEEGDIWCMSVVWAPSPVGCEGSVLPQ